MTNGPVPPVPRVPPAPGPPQKKGLHPLVWVGVGCAGVALIGMLVMVVGGMFVFNKAKNFAEDMEDNPAATMARVIAAANPDIEIVDEDEDAGTMTFHNVRTDEQVTISYQDIEDGKLSFSTHEGTASFDVRGGEKGEATMTITTDEGTSTFNAGADLGDVPAWVPIYSGTEPEGAFTTDTPQGLGGTYSAKTNDALADVLDFFARELESAGLAIKNRTTTPEGAMLAAEAGDQSRTASVILGERDDRVEIVVQYAEKR